MSMDLDLFFLGKVVCTHVNMGCCLSADFRSTHMNVFRKQMLELGLCLRHESMTTVGHSLRFQSDTGLKGFGLIARTFTNSCTLIQPEG